VSGLSVECRESLRKIATLFKRVNGVVFNEAEREQRQFDDEKKISLAPSLTRRSQSLYLETEILFLHYRGQLVIPSTDSDSVHDLLRYLSGEAPLDAELIVWRKAVGTLLEHQGPAVYNSEPHWAMAKAQAHDILDFRNDAAEIFDEIYQELTLKHLYEVRESISLRLRMLEKFVAIYDRQPTPYNDSYNPPPEPRYELFPLPSKQRRKKISEAYSTAQFQVSAFSRSRRNIKYSYPVAQLPLGHYHTYRNSGTIYPDSTGLAKVFIAARLNLRCRLLAPCPIYGYAIAGYLYRHLCII
jgi:hypothetical protein